jgi:UDP:flavonoid glycosyltransferase YjiC (YdhE family)
VKCTHRGATGCRLSPDFGFSSSFNSLLKLSLRPFPFVFAASSEKLYNIYVNIIWTHANMKLFYRYLSTGLSFRQLSFFPCGLQNQLLPP